MFSPHMVLLPPPKILDKNISFSKALKMYVVPVAKYYKTSDFIDDIISARHFSKNRNG